MVRSLRLSTLVVFKFYVAVDFNGALCVYMDFRFTFVQPFMQHPVYGVCKCARRAFVYD